MSRVALTASLCTVLWLGAASPSDAQPEAGRVFIGASALASIERSTRSSNFGFDVPDRDGTVAGGSLSLGVYFTPKISARLEWSMTDWLEYDSDLGILPLIARPGIGSTLPERLIAPQPFDGRQRAKGASMLLGYHLSSSRASLELLGGLGVIAETTRSSYDFWIAQPVATEALTLLPYPRGESRFSEYRSVGVVGVDVAVRLTEHAAVVPQFRAYSSGGGLTLRPGVGVRWTF